MTEVVDGDALPSLLARHRAVYLFVGHGDKNQYRDVGSSVAAVCATAGRLDTAHGAGGWLAVYGGDSYDPDVPTLAHLARALASRGTAVLAVQCTKARDEWGWAEANAHIPYALFYPTDTGGADGAVRWGGVGDDGSPVGGTAVYLGPAFREALAGVVAVGGGPVAAAEAQFAQEHLGLDVYYLAAAARHPPPEGEYGAVHSWASAHALPLERLGAHC